jgi:hypothetical protein
MPAIIRILEKIDEIDDIFSAAKKPPVTQSAQSQRLKKGASVSMHVGRNTKDESFWKDSRGKNSRTP